MSTKRDEQGTRVLLLPHNNVLVYYYASNIMLEESMMQVSFGITTIR